MAHILPLQAETDHSVTCKRPNLHCYSFMKFSCGSENQVQILYHDPEGLSHPGSDQPLQLFSYPNSRSSALHQATTWFLYISCSYSKNAQPITHTHPNFTESPQLSLRWYDGLFNEAIAEGNSHAFAFSFQKFFRRPHYVTGTGINNPRALGSNLR